eukprot:TRINITY_DN76483_c0_g1_i1.p1 TRINITY_DN76483_c0_g1~~TRINITY_DN76483_c0_g1_i1.p1  ORF type:complete len:339 (-),score=17.82 TRINITY_DN76483_c0_g1_i1:54-1070(-)
MSGLTITQLPHTLVEVIDSFLQDPNTLSITCKQFWSIVGGNWTASRIVGSACFDQCPHKDRLKHLSLRLQFNVQDELQPVAQHCGGTLQSLLLSNSLYAHLQAPSIQKAGKQLQLLCGLKTLVVYSSAVPKKFPGWLAIGLHNKPELNTLVLDFSKCQTPSVSVLSSFFSVSFPKIQDLNVDLTSCGLIDHHLLNFMNRANVKQLHSLKLDLSNNNLLSSTGLVDWFVDQNLVYMTNLTKLDLRLQRLPGLTDQAVRRLSWVIGHILVSLGSLFLAIDGCLKLTGKPTATALKEIAAGKALHYVEIMLGNLPTADRVASFFCHDPACKHISLAIVRKF